MFQPSSDIQYQQNRWLFHLMFTFCGILVFVFYSFSLFVLQWENNSILYFNVVSSIFSLYACLRNWNYHSVKKNIFFGRIQVLITCRIQDACACSVISYFAPTSNKPNLPTYIRVIWGPIDWQTDWLTDRLTDIPYHRDARCVKFISSEQNSKCFEVHFWLNAIVKDYLVVDVKKWPLLLNIHLRDDVLYQQTGDIKSCGK
jgi:hypothetical protein